MCTEYHNSHVHDIHDLYRICSNEQPIPQHNQSPPGVAGAVTLSPTHLLSPDSGDFMGISWGFHGNFMGISWGFHDISWGFHHWKW